MKKSLFLPLMITLMVLGCTKDNTSTTPLDDTADTTAVLKYSGQFMNGPYGTVSGFAKIYLQNNQYKLALENVAISNGPDLHVYLSKEVQPVNYIDFGPLQSTAGNQLYPITGNPNFSEYKYALIHCQRFNHLFGSAELR